jgi:hypothetical protein
MVSGQSELVTSVHPPIKELGRVCTTTSINPFSDDEEKPLVYFASSVARSQFVPIANHPGPLSRPFRRQVDLLVLALQLVARCTEKKRKWKTNAVYWIAMILGAA